MLVGSLAPWGLGDLVRALLPEHPEIDVYRDVRVVETLPVGSKLILVPRREDAPALNMARPIFARRDLKVILACDQETSEALLKHAPDFFDWISIYVEWPWRPTPHAVQGLRRSVEVGARGIVWIDRQDAESRAHSPENRLAEALDGAFPGQTLVHLDIDASFDQIMAQIGSEWRHWLFVETTEYWHLRRIRWAFADARKRTRTVLMAKTADAETALESLSPWFVGYAPVHDRIATFEQGHDILARVSSTHPGRLAALLAYEPEAIALCARLLEHGESEILLTEQLLHALDPGSFVARMAFDRAILHPDECDLNRASPPVFRALATKVSVLQAESKSADPIVLDWLNDAKAAVYAFEQGDDEIGILWGERALEDNPAARTNLELLVGLANAYLVPWNIERRRFWESIPRHKHAWNLLCEAARLIPNVEHPLYVPCAIGLMSASLHDGKWYQAKATADQAIVAIDARLGAKHPGLGRLMLAIAEMYRRDGHLLVAGFILRRLLQLDLADESFSTDDAEAVVFEFIDRDFKNASRAIDEWWYTAPPIPEDDKWIVLAELGQWHLEQAQANEALRYLRQAWTLATQQFEKSHPQIDALFKSMEHATRVLEDPPHFPPSAEKQEAVIHSMPRWIISRLNKLAEQPATAQRTRPAASPFLAQSAIVRVDELRDTINEALRHRVHPLDIDDVKAEIILRLVVRGSEQWFALPKKETTDAIRNVVKTYRKKRRAINRYLGKRVTDIELDDLTIEDDSPNDALEYRDAWNNVAMALGRLRHSDRRILGLYFFEEKTIAHIADELGISSNTASKRLQDALRELRMRISGGVNPF